MAQVSQGAPRGSYGETEVKVLHLTDTHFTNRHRYGHVGVDGVNPRFQDQLDRLKDVLTIAEERAVDYIVHSGDFWNNPNPTNLEREKVAEVLSDYLRRELLIIPGQHDIGFGSHALAELERLGMDLIYVFSEPCEEFRGMLFIPWQEPVAVERCLMEYVEATSLEECARTTVVGHFLVSGFRTPSGFEIIDGVAREVLSPYRYVLLGDLHQPIRSGYMLYAGSLIRLNWGEKNIEPGCWVVDVDGPKDPERVDLPDREMIEVDLENLPQVPQVEGNIFRVVVRDPGANLALVRNDLYDQGAFFVSCRREKERMVTFHQDVERSSFQETVLEGLSRLSPDAASLGEQKLRQQGFVTA